MIRSFSARLALTITAGLIATGALATPALAAGTGTVEGVFSTRSGAPIADAMVIVWTGDGSDVHAHTWTDATGHYEATVPAGEVILAFDSNGLGQWAPGQRDRAAAQVHTVTDGATLTVDERQIPTGTITGVVTQATGAPAAGVHVYAGDVNGSTDQAGRYSLTVFADSYRVAFQGPGGRQWAPQAITEAGATTVAVAAGASTQVDEQLLASGSIGGRLTTASGEPLAWTSVTLHHGDSAVGWATTDDNGDYSFGAVPVGGYVVSFSLPSGGEQFVPGAADRADATTYTVVSGQTLTVNDTVPA